VYSLDDTIVAVASPPGGAARGILRLSGPDVRACVESVFRIEPPRELTAIRVPTAVAGSLALGGVASPLPCDLLLWPTGRSYTGQPVAELHTLGSPPLLELALEALCEAGARLAQPGEFTLRAFLAGRLDLTQAEAVLGVIDAADGRQLEVALQQLAGGLAGPLRRLRGGLLDLLAHLEAGFDFADEDLPFITPGQLDEQLAAAGETVDRLLEQMVSRRETADLVRVVLVGWPNTGKSSLFNALLGRTGALVSETPGTTRDYLTAELDLDGRVRCLLVDTAGIEPDAAPPEDSVRRAAQTAAVQQARSAQVRLLCLDSTRPLNSRKEAELARHVEARLEDSGQDFVGQDFRSLKDFGSLLVVLTKTDLPRRLDFTSPAVATSSATGHGLEAIKEQIAAAVLAARGGEGEVVACTAVRCRESLRLAAECLRRARQVLAGGSGEELVAAELRVALDELGQVVGAVYTEDILDRIFSRFCVGK
jgi:tRNA modification GTPase